jgi:hypothetical protein
MPNSKVQIRNRKGEIGALDLFGFWCLFFEISWKRLCPKNTMLQNCSTGNMHCGGNSVQLRFDISADHGDLM